MNDEESELYTLRALRHASERLRGISARLQRLLNDWHTLENVHRRDEVRAIKEDFDNAITPVVNWPVWAEENGLIPSEGGDDDD